MIDIEVSGIYESLEQSGSDRHRTGSGREDDEGTAGTAGSHPALGGSYEGGVSGFPIYDPQCMPLVEDDFLRTASNNAVDAGSAVSSSGRWCRMHRLVFEKRMGWKFTAEDRQIFM